MEDEKDILQRMSSGDSDAFRLVFLKYAPRVEAFAMKMLKNIHEAQDVSQNISSPNCGCSAVNWPRFSRSTLTCSA